MATKSQPTNFGMASPIELLEYPQTFNITRNLCIARGHAKQTRKGRTPFVCSFRP
jgi:hypothetical protein